MLLNNSGDPIRFTVGFTAPNIFNPQTNSVVFDMRFMGQTVPVNLGSQRFSDPMGNGTLKQHEFIRYTTVTCLP